MTTQLQTTSVTTAIEVQAPINHYAFRVFTEGIGSWWDPAHHILQAELAEMVVSSRESAATSSIAAPTAASAAGPGCSPMIRHIGSASAGT